MKISVQLFNKIKEAIRESDSYQRIEDHARAYEIGDFPRSDKVQDLQCRFCFDMWYAVPAHKRNPIMDKVYEAGCNDNHLYTVLKRILPKVERKF